MCQNCNYLVIGQSAIEIGIFLLVQHFHIQTFLYLGTTSIKVIGGRFSTMILCNLFFLFFFFEYFDIQFLEK